MKGILQSGAKNLISEMIRDFFSKVKVARRLCRSKK